MTCKDAEKMISLFLEDDLEMDDLRKFLEHIDNCSECKEELTIQFLVSEGMARLESGNVFDLQNELKYCIEEAGHTLKLRESMRWLLYVIQGLTVFAGIILIILLVILF
ncbi:MAG: zf-HC2 domain-containing protein [Lachnospiraceae bacterium]|nr:zf-HC2 domain-containing protein [Lachnospiraceae bacterium]MDE6185913.1 zf-HC2 domain-containing protein [Lachnospiraceae bacterium]MDE7287011.1 zf-HC2 domain-containing protein [Lachnospiraceae bacterium]